MLTRVSVGSFPVLSQVTANGSVGIARLLLAAGAKHDARDARGMDVMHYASLYKQSEVARLLREYHADQTGATYPHTSQGLREEVTQMKRLQKLTVSDNGAAVAAAAAAKKQRQQEQQPQSQDRKGSGKQQLSTKAKRRAFLSGLAKQASGKSQPDTMQSASGTLTSTPAPTPRTQMQQLLVQDPDASNAALLRPWSG